MIPTLLIDSRPRSCSHLLTRSLQALPGVVILDEPFHPLYGEYGREGVWLGHQPLADWLQDSWAAQGGVRLRGILTHEEQLAGRDDVIGVLQEVITHVVILSRENLLAQFASRKIAEQTNEWRSDPGLPPTSETLTAHPGEYELFCARMAASRETSRRRWSRLPCLEITAEDLVNSWACTLREVSQLVEVDLNDAVPRTEQRERRPLSEVVLNFSDFVEP